MAPSELVTAAALRGVRRVRGVRGVRGAGEGFAATPGTAVALGCTRLNPVSVDSIAFQAQPLERTSGRSEVADMANVVYGRRRWDALTHFTSRCLCSAEKCEIERRSMGFAMSALHAVTYRKECPYGPPRCAGAFHPRELLRATMCPWLGEL